MFAKVRVSRRKYFTFYPEQRDSTLALKAAGSHMKISTFEIVLKTTDLNSWVNYNKSVHLCAR